MTTQTANESTQPNPDLVAPFRAYFQGKITKWRPRVHFSEPLPPEETDWHKIVYVPKNDKEAAFFGLRFILECLRVSDPKNHRKTWITGKQLKTTLHQWTAIKQDRGQGPSLIGKHLTLCGVEYKGKRVNDGRKTKVWRGVTLAPDFVFSETDPRGEHTPTIETHLEQIRPLFWTDATSLGLQFLRDCLRVSDLKNYKQTWITQRDLINALDQWNAKKENRHPPSTKLLVKHFFPSCGIRGKTRKVDGRNVRVWLGVALNPDFIPPTDTSGKNTPTIETHLAEIRHLFTTATDETKKN